MSSKDFEVRLISGIMNYGKDLKDYVLENVQPHYFSDKKNREVISVIRSLLVKNIEPISENVYSEFQRRGIDNYSELKRIETSFFDLSDSEVIEGIDRLRQIYIWEKADKDFELIHKYRLEGRDADFAVLEVARRLADIVSDNNTDFSDGTTPISEDIREYLTTVDLMRQQKIPPPELIKSVWFPTLNITGGFAKTNLIFITGKYKNGKTTFALALALEMALSNKKSVGFASLEMSKEAELFPKILSQMTNVQYLKIKNASKELTDREVFELSEAVEKIEKTKFYISESSLDENALELMIRRWVTDLGVDVVFIDYLQLIKLSKAERRDMEISNFTSNLKRIAKKLKVIIVVLAQENEDGDTRESKSPLMDGDFRFSVQAYQPNPDGTVTIDGGKNIGVLHGVFKVSCLQSRHSVSGWSFYFAKTKQGFRELSL